MDRQETGVAGGRQSRRLAAALLSGLLTLLAVEAQAASQLRHEYRVAVDPSLERMTVEARFDGAVDTVAARSRRAGRYLLDFRNCDTNSQIRLRNHRLIVPADGIRCMSYTVDLRAAAGEQRQNRGLDPANLIASPSVWLWRPAISETTELEVDFELPPGVSVAVPWDARDDSNTRFVIRNSPESASAPIAFGRFEYREIDVPGATLRVSLMRGREPMDAAEILRWVEAAAIDVSLAYGQFPNPSPQVLVIPVADSGRSGGSVVPYGRVVRDGGETVELFINQDRPLSAFLDDWTATHEFSHLMLPYVRRDHRWISEGFAQYYQNVLLARSGAYDHERAWQKLYEGFERGRLSRPELSPNDAAAGGNRAGTMKVYWSGAALALMADVELRGASGGEQTLDDVMQRLRACCLPSSRAWSGPELFAKLDELAGRDVFMPLYRRYANAVGFPDPEPVFEQLGVRVEHGQVRLLRNSRLASVRDAITAVDREAASWREHLALRE